MEKKQKKRKRKKNLSTWKSTKRRVCFSRQHYKTSLFTKSLCSHKKKVEKEKDTFYWQRSSVCCNFFINLPLTVFSVLYHFQLPKKREKYKKMMKDDGYDKKFEVQVKWNSCAIFVFFNQDHQKCLLICFSTNQTTVINEIKSFWIRRKVENKIFWEEE